MKCVRRIKRFVAVVVVFGDERGLFKHYSPFKNRHSNNFKEEQREKQ